MPAWLFPTSCLLPCGIEILNIHLGCHERQTKMQLELTSILLCFNHLNRAMAFYHTVARFKYLGMSMQI